MRKKKTFEYTSYFAAEFNGFLAAATVLRNDAY